MIPSDIVGQRVHVQYKTDDTIPPQPWRGKCVATHPFVILEHDGHTFVKSYLRPERIVSIHVLKEDASDRPGEAVPQGAYPRPA